IDRARLVPDLVGAANWLALAMWAAAKIAPGREGFLLDIGSSTTDVCAFRDGRALPRGRADHERLRTGELIYTGVRRTPLCALATRVTVGETPTFIAAELFATTLDLYLLAGDVAEDPKDRDTADGRPATIDAGRARLARMLCADAANLGTDAIARLARAFADAQLQTIVDGARGVIERAGVRSEVAVISGSGEFLARRAAERLGAASILSIAEHLDRGRSEAACAWALIELASR
ncbi:MAG TPA: hydantoinase/oxoprolinase family protein, partial [Planctomycetota bacterium]|nr:hydantoinase/oxoprolinase family protein [Planctomycetota bacterium]